MEQLARFWLSPVDPLMLRNEGSVTTSVELGLQIRLNLGPRWGSDPRHLAPFHYISILAPWSWLMQSPRSAFEVSIRTHWLYLDDWVDMLVSASHITDLQ